MFFPASWNVVSCPSPRKRNVTRHSNRIINGTSPVATGRPLRDKPDPPPLQWRRQSLREEIANSISHGLGVLFGIAALVILVVLAARQGDAWRVVSFSIYGASIIMLYLASTLYHAFTRERTKRFFKLMDHASIYFLIAGTYTPILLVAMRGPWGWSMFGVIWGLAILGVLFKIFFIGRLKVLSVLIYLLMGWMIVIAFKPMLAMVPPGMLFWLIVGGACYSLGVVFYVWRTFPFHHTVWHLFVLSGSISHFMGILLHLA
ncbi:hemolysin III family protein [bacterium]|nr:hemolysin III family protein [bacterium]